MNKWFLVLFIWIIALCAGAQEERPFILIKKLEIDSAKGLKKLEIIKFQDGKKIEEVYLNADADKKLKEIGDEDIKIITNNLP
ncbi:MAG: hypothetical protein D6707_06965, partial [Bacteroidetes bacterium]